MNAYAGFVPDCGCLVAAVSADPEFVRRHPDDVSRFLQEMEDGGLEVRLVDTAKLELCPHGALSRRRFERPGGEAS